MAAKPVPSPRATTRLSLKCEGWVFSTRAVHDLRRLSLRAVSVAEVLAAPDSSMPAAYGEVREVRGSGLAVLVPSSGSRLVIAVGLVPTADPEEDAPARAPGGRGVPRAKSGGSGSWAPSSGRGLADRLVLFGFACSPKGSGHIEARHPGFDESFIIPSTPSDARSLPNSMAYIKRRTGIDVRKEPPRKGRSATA